MLAAIKLEIGAILPELLEELGLLAALELLAAKHAQARRVQIRLSRTPGGR